LAIEAEMDCRQIAAKIHQNWQSTDRFLNGDFAERVHRKLDIVDIDASLVGLDTDLDGIVNDSLHGNQHAHVV
jgi:hypothetical protein